MKAITEDSKTIVFYEENHMVLKLVYAGRFSHKASIIDAENQVYEIDAVNFWKTRFEIRLNQQCLFTIKKKWGKTAEISTNKDSTRNILLFKHKGFFKFRYVIQDKDDRELVVVKSKFRWKGFGHDYDIEVSDSLRRNANHLVILGIMVYLVRNSQRKHAGGGAAMGGAIAAIT